MSLKTSPKFHFYFSRWVFFTKKQNQLINATWLKSWKKCWENLLCISLPHLTTIHIFAQLSIHCCQTKKWLLQWQKRGNKKVASRFEGGNVESWRLTTYILSKKFASLTFCRLVACSSSYFRPVEIPTWNKSFLIHNSSKCDCTFLFMNTFK